MVLVYRFRFCTISIRSSYQCFSFFLTFFSNAHKQYITLLEHLVFEGFVESSFKESPIEIIWSLVLFGVTLIMYSISSTKIDQFKHSISNLSNLAIEIFLEIFCRKLSFSCSFSNSFVCRSLISYDFKIISYFNHFSPLSFLIFIFVLLSFFHEQISWWFVYLVNSLFF